MQLFKDLNRKLYIVFSIVALLLFFSNIAEAITVTSNLNPVKIRQRVSFSSIVTVAGAGSPSTLDVFADYGDGTKEVRVYTVSVGAAGPVNVSFNYTYSKPGAYHVRVRATIATPYAIVGSNPGVMTQQVGGPEITHMRLYFDNNKPEITIKKNQKSPKLFTKIIFRGSGQLKGHWEIDGKKRGHVHKYFAKGSSVIIKYPDIPSLPTFHYGTHKVRFVIDEPKMSINFPYAVYFITSDEKVELARINLIQPVEGEEIAYKPLTFKWDKSDMISLYLITIFSKTKKERIFSAYIREGEFKLTTKKLKSHMRPFEQYIWSVIGFNDKNEIIAESVPSLFSFNQETAFVPGQILFLTESTIAGEKIVQQVKEKYRLKILQTYFIETVGLQVTQFYSDQKTAGIISKLKQTKGVVSVQPNYIFKTMSEPMYGLQSIRKTIKIDPDIPFKGKGVTVAVVDTGVDLKHKDLKGAILSHKNFLPDSNYRSEIHGTAVAGLIGARKNNFGIEGFAPQSKIIALRACKQISKTQPRGVCYSLSIAKALDAGIQKKAQIINMSLGTSVKDILISKLIDKGSNMGILFVAPAGNSSEASMLSFPASHPKVISVAGLTEKGEFFPNAMVAKKSDFYLPCNNLFSTVPNNKHNFLSGTSLSSAVVSGLLVLAHEKNREMIAMDLRSFDGDINRWVNKFLMSKNIATTKKN